MNDDTQKKIFARNLTYYIALNGKMQTEVAKDIGVNATTLNTWCTGKAMPALGKIQRLADYFGVGKSDLTDEKPELDTNDEYKSICAKIGAQDKRFQRVMVAYYNLPVEDKTLFCDFFERFITREGGA